MIAPLRTNHRVMDAVIKWAGQVDEKDLSDAAREWAENDANLTAVPENRGEFMAALEMAFEAGRMYQRQAGGE